MKHILVVDDNKVNLSSAKAALNHCYKVTAVMSGVQALKFLEKNTCDLILLDIKMPEMNGFEVMSRIQKMENCRDIPIIFLTANNDPETENRCLEKGAVDFIAKPFVVNVMLSRIRRILELEDLKNNLEEKIEEKTKHISYIQQMMVLGMATMVESRDNSTGGHIKRTSGVVQILSDKLLENEDTLPKEFLDMVVRAAPMHDLGKITIEDKILRKQGSFTNEDYEVMKKHSEEGARIVGQLLQGVEEDRFVKIAVNMAHYHHEKWDGTGYPEGLAGEEIPIEARIMALADVFDALVSKRCYKEALSVDSVFEMIEESIGTQFDPKLGAVFLTCREELKRFYEKNRTEI